MASVTSSTFLTCKYSISGGGSELSSLASMATVPVGRAHKSTAVTICRAQQAKTSDSNDTGLRRAALFGLGAALIISVASSSFSPSANAGVIEDYLEKSKVNKELNDKKRLATSGANFARAYTVQFGTCKFPENFTGCQDLAKQKKVPFLSDDLQLECQGKDKYKCGSNVFWKW